MHMEEGQNETRGAPELILIFTWQLKIEKLGAAFAVFFYYEFQKSLLLKNIGAQSSIFYVNSID
jgi:hypothetical protein